MKELLRKKSQYHKIRVEESDNIRYLIFDGGMTSQQSAIDVVCPERHVFDYSELALNSLFFVPSPNKVLVLGLGGGVFPMAMHRAYPHVHIDIIEIDPVVVDIAKRFCGFKESSIVSVHIGDAFDVVPNMDYEYDIIFADAFNGSYIPFHLMCIEFFESLKNKLGKSSVLAVNICPYHPSYHSHVRTLMSVLGNNIYASNPIRNRHNKMLFIVPENVKFSHLPSNIHMLPICDDIKSASIFSLRSV